MFKNICLIGLPYSGKSSISTKLAFNRIVGCIEIDRMIEFKYKNKLKTIIENKGLNNFLKIEEKVALTLHCENSIISTGGSIVYSNNAIDHFKKNLNSKIVHLDLSFNEFNYRAKNLEQRGVINPSNLDLKGLYYERKHLCNLVSDITIPADNKNLAYNQLLKIYNTLINY